MKEYKKEIKQKLKLNIGEKVNIGLCCIALLIAIIGAITTKDVIYLAVVILWVDIIIERYSCMKVNKLHALNEERLKDTISMLSK